MWLFSKSKNWVLTFFHTLRFFFLKRIEFLPFALPYNFFSKVRIEFSPFVLPCSFVRLFVCVFLFVCLFVWVFEKLKSSSYLLLTMCFFFSKGSGSYLSTYRVCLFDCFFVCMILFLFCLFGLLKSCSIVCVFYCLFVFVCLFGFLKS